MDDHPAKCRTWATIRPIEPFYHQDNMRGTSRPSSIVRRVVSYGSQSSFFYPDGYTLAFGHREFVYGLLCLFQVSLSGLVGEHNNGHVAVLFAALLNDR